MSEEFVSGMAGMAFHMPVFRFYAVSFVDTDQWASPKNTIWKAFPDTILRSEIEYTICLAKYLCPTVFEKLNR